MRSRKPKEAIRIFVLLAFAVSGMATACSSAPTAGTDGDEGEASGPSDASISVRVESRLAVDPEVNNFEIDVDTTDGVVRLSGTVETEGDREAAETLARNTEGVKDVENEIRIGDPTAKDNVTDAWIVTKITAKLTADPDVSPFGIDVDAVQGVVTLTGTVDKEAAREAALDLARNTKGVLEVEDRIQVKP